MWAPYFVCNRLYTPLDHVDIAKHKEQNLTTQVQVMKIWGTTGLKFVVTEPNIDITKIMNAIQGLLMPLQ